MATSKNPKAPKQVERRAKPPLEVIPVSLTPEQIFQERSQHRWMIFALTILFGGAGMFLLISGISKEFGSGMIGTVLGYWFNLVNIPGYTKD